MKSLAREYIGDDLEVLEASNPSLQGLKGKILNETKNTFVVLTPEGVEKTVLKKGCVFKIGKDVIKGDLILKSPEERIKLL